jgi:glycosyltransferase involved in cell wall biosynthesis
MRTNDEFGVKSVAWVAENLTTGGIGTVCRYAAEGVAHLSGCRATVVSLRPPPSEKIDADTGVRYVSLGVEQKVSQAFLHWLARNPQQFVITNDVARMESSFPYFPRETMHIIGIHDSARSHLDLAVRNRAWIDGVACVAMHIEKVLEARMRTASFGGLLQTVHNGARFPSEPLRESISNRLRLLYMGSVDPFKGVYDAIPILLRLRRMGVPVELKIVGGTNDWLRRIVKRKQLDSMITWSGWVTHEDCYRVAAESDVLLMPSRKEAFGMVTIEAMAMGCVPLAYDIRSGSREIIENGLNGLLLPLGDFAAWALAIKSLYEDRQRLHELSKAAMKRARSQFNVENMSRQLCWFMDRVQKHAQACPSDRKAGSPQVNSIMPHAPRSHYQRITPSVRQWVRNQIGACPRLCHWLLNRW